MVGCHACLIFVSSQLAFNVATHMEFTRKSKPCKNRVRAAKFETLDLFSPHWPLPTCMQVAFSLYIWSSSKAFSIISSQNCFHLEHCSLLSWPPLPTLLLYSPSFLSLLAPSMVSFRLISMRPLALTFKILCGLQ